MVLVLINCTGFKLLIHFYLYCRDPTYTPSNQEKKFIVFESCLLSLFSLCFVCFSKKVQASVSYIIGTFVAVTQTCKQCGHAFKWSSQPYLGSLPAGNILLSSAILFAGGLPRKTFNIFKFLGVACISENTFFRHQSSFLYRTIDNVWNIEECCILTNIKRLNLPLKIGGDGRNDSVGHCAKYGSYTLMDLDQKKIIAIQIIQVWHT